MNKDQAIELLHSLPVKQLLIGVVKLENGEYGTATSICSTREETFAALKQMESVRVFYLRESKEDAVYLKNESKKL